MSKLLATLTVLVVLIWLADRAPYDDTDNAIAGLRSGAHLVIDYGTGCHYLSGLLGGVTPRLDEHGQHICRAADRRGS